MPGPVATPKSGYLHANEKRAEHLRLVERAVAKKYLPDRTSEIRRKPEIADEAEDLWDNVPV